MPITTQQDGGSSGPLEEVVVTGQQIPSGITDPQAIRAFLDSLGSSAVGSGLVGGAGSAPTAPVDPRTDAEKALDSYSEQYNKLISGEITQEEFVSWLEDNWDDIAGDFTGVTWSELEAMAGVMSGDLAGVASNILNSAFEQVFGDNVRVVFEPSDVSAADEQIVLPPLIAMPERPDRGGGGAQAGAQAPQEEVVDITTDTTIPQDTTADQGILDAERSYEYEGEGVFTDVTTGATVTDPNYDPENDPYTVGDVYSYPSTTTVEEQPAGQPTEEGITVGDVLDAATTINTILGGSTDGTATGTATEGTGTADGGAEGGTGGGVGTGTGTGSGEGDGSGETTAEKAARSGFGDSFTPFYTSIGYQPVQMLAPVLPQQKDYMRELDGLFNRTISNRKQGMLV